jgi:hypothetical protein
MLMLFCVLEPMDSQLDANVSEKHSVSIFSSDGGDRMFLRNVFHLPGKQHVVKIENIIFHVMFMQKENKPLHCFDFT